MENALRNAEGLIGSEMSGIHVDQIFGSCAETRKKTLISCAGIIWLGQMDTFSLAEGSNINHRFTGDLRFFLHNAIAEKMVEFDTKAKLKTAMACEDTKRDLLQWVKLFFERSDTKTPKANIAPVLDARHLAFISRLNFLLSQ